MGLALTSEADLRYMRRITYRFAADDGATFSPTKPAQWLPKHNREGPMTVLSRRRARDGSTRDEGRRGIAELVREIVGQVEDDENPTRRPRMDRDHEEILIDTQVDGARYLLVRVPEARPLLIPLSPREQEIVQMVAKGYPNKTIAGVLNISTWTVCTHLRRTFAKLGVTSRAAMVARLMETNRTWETLEPETERRPTTKLPTTSSSRPSDGKVLKRAMPERGVTRLIGIIFTPVWPSVMLACGASGIG
jgi:DNA-binding CsgD family transcriptional regulator